MQDEEILQLMSSKTVDADISIIEGNKGLYDGLDLDGSNSNAALAALTDTPVVLVLDAAIGQESVHVAEVFNEQVGLTGLILTKLDGDARGGAALSVRSVTGCPVLLVGTGEKVEDLEATKGHAVPEAVPKDAVAVDVHRLNARTGHVERTHFLTETDDNTKMEIKSGF